MKNIKIIIMMTLMVFVGFSFQQTYAFSYQDSLIRHGSRGDQVLQVQTCMNRLGYNVGLPDGIYGQKTLAGIVRFQATIPELINDGVIGPKTAPFFQKACVASIETESGIDIIISDEKNNNEMVFEPEPEPEPEPEQKPEQESTIPVQNTVNVNTSASTVNVGGNNNDYAEFRVNFELGAFGNVFYVSEYALNSIEYRVVDAATGIVVYDSDGLRSGTSLVTLSSTASVDDNSYRINEDEYESFEIDVTYNPYGGIPAGIGSYRLVLDQVHYSNSPGGSLLSYMTRPESKFRTSPTNIID